MSSSERSKDDYTCPICMYIMIHPITMPCKHSLCLMCYKQCVEKASLACPICRLRISVWARKNAKANTLIDRPMWETIQRRFPVEVRNHIEGKDESTDDNWDSPSAIEAKLRKFKELSEPGEIRQEYVAALAKLDRQREEEAKREEEASAALIRALQEEEEEELSKLAKQREEHEKLGRQAAEQIFQETRASHHERRLRHGAKMKSKKRCESASMKLESFYNSYRKSSNSAPPRSEFATTLSNNQENKKDAHVSKTDYSPYPYDCISPSDKTKVTPSLPSEITGEAIDESSFCLTEHSYTTASAERIDLTSQDDGTDWASILREDVQQYIKVEPPDLEDPLGETSDSCASSSIFQPICSSLKTPPKKLPSGEIVDPVLIRSVPRSLTFCFGESNLTISPSVASCSSEIFPDQSSEFRDVSSEFLNGFDSRKEEMSTSTSPSVRQLNSEKNDDEFVAKMKLTRKIVYGTSKHKKHGHVTTSACSSLPHRENYSSSTSSETRPLSTSNSGFSERVSSDDMTLKEASISRQIGINQNINRTNSESKGDESDEIGMSDFFMPGDSRLLIPLESEVEVSFSCEPSNPKNTDRTLLKTLKKPAVQKKGTKSTARPSSSSSIRDWCLKGKRKTVSSCGSHCDNKSSAEQDISLEEADRLFALELQKLYSQQDKRSIKVDRFEGSSNEYSFRKKRKLF